MKRTLFYLGGLCLIAFGVANIVTADLGAGAWDAVAVGLSNTFGLTMGTWIMINGLLIMFFNAYLLKERPDFLAFLTTTILGLLSDFWLLQVFSNVTPESLFQQGLFFVIGFVAIVIGAGIYLQANFAPSPVDKLMLAVHQRFNISIAKSRLFSEAFAITMSLVFSGPISYGTVLFAVGIGPCIQLVHQPMKKLYEGRSKVTV